MAKFLVCCAFPVSLGMRKSQWFELKPSSNYTKIWNFTWSNNWLNPYGDAVTVFIVPALFYRLAWIILFLHICFFFKSSSDQADYSYITFEISSRYLKRCSIQRISLLRSNDSYHHLLSHTVVYLLKHRNTSIDSHKFKSFIKFPY